ncbi:MAG: GNAT family N-acetyltransferase [Candidatus Palauibacterales bacterium]|jgi:ribosomal protein S18 acetylase RimI-like enzyme|nr:GNAT family N-acetyltransferase [Candidatus Palauibacterales bacterium]
MRVRVLGREEMPAVVSVLCESFFDYPVMRWVLGPEDGFEARLETLVTFFVIARVLRDEFLLGVTASGGLAAAALVSHPGRGRSPPELSVIRERTWAELGAEARLRYESFGAAVAEFNVESEHMHLNMIGVRSSAQGQGLGRSVLEAVHDLSASDTESTGVTLSTEVESNVSLYEHFGYEVVGSATIDSAFTTWVMYRSDRER